MSGYSLVILAGLGFGGATLFYTISELMATSPEQKVYNKALSEVRADGQVSVYLVSGSAMKQRLVDSTRRSYGGSGFGFGGAWQGAPLTAYGSNSTSRTQRQQIPHRFYNDLGTGAQRVQVEKKKAQQDADDDDDFGTMSSCAVLWCAQVQFHVRGPSGHAVVTADASVSDNSFRFLYVDVDDIKGSSPLHRPMRITLHPSPFQSLQSPPPTA